MTSTQSAFTGQFSKLTTWHGCSDACSHVRLHLPIQVMLWSRDSGVTKPHGERPTV